MEGQHESSFGRSFLDRMSNEIVRDSPWELQVYPERTDHGFHQIEACYDMNHRYESLPADFLMFQLSKFLNFLIRGNFSMRKILNVRLPFV